MLKIMKFLTDTLSIIILIGSKSFFCLCLPIFFLLFFIRDIIPASSWTLKSCDMSTFHLSAADSWVILLQEFENKTEPTL